MARFISISGPSTTGKTSLINNLSTHQEISHAIFSPDMHDVVWGDLVERRLFYEFSDISTDPEYLCTYLIRLADYYNQYMDAYEDTDSLVILDGCWLDLAIYSTLNMWYNRNIRPVQEEILSKISKYDSRVSKIYLTRADDDKYPVDRLRLRGKMSTFRANRGLEIGYYKIADHLDNSITLPSTDMDENSLFILNDLKNLGYL